MVSTPEFIQTVGHGLGATSYRQVRFNHINAAASLQFTILGSTNFGSNALAQKDWGSNELFCKRTIHIDSKDSEYYKRTESCGDFNHTKVDRSTILAMGPKKEPFKNRMWYIYAWRISGRQGCHAVVGQKEPLDRLFTQ